MICVSIGRGRHRMFRAEMEHLAEKGAQLLELRLDYLKGRVSLNRLIDNRPCPVIITVRRPQDGGRFSGTEEQRRVLLRSAIVAGVEYVDLEEDAARAIPRFGKTKRIVSYHDFRRTPEDLEEIHARLAALDADIVKIATMANHPHDNVRMLQLVQQAKVPTVGLCMGDIGTPSRVLAGKFGAPFTYATFHHERTLAPGQLSYDEMTRVYHYDQIGPETEVYGVIADPVGHSLSPLIHNTAFRAQGLNKVYLPFRVPPDDLAEFLQSDVEALGVRGLSVTIPHKERVTSYLDYMDPGVEGTGAANTIVWEDGQRKGFNTDIRAALESLEVHMRSRGGSAKDLKGRTALILGAGGVAKAIAYALTQLRMNVVISGRTLGRAEELADLFGCGVVEWERRHEVECDLLVNCTPVGMHPKVDETPYRRSALRPEMIVFDTVYNPENTLLIKDAKETECHTITGVDMFVRQAAAQFKLFTGQQAPAKLMLRTLKSATSAVKY